MRTASSLFCNQPPIPGAEDRARQLRANPKAVLLGPEELDSLDAADQVIHETQHQSNLPVAHCGHEDQQVHHCLAETAGKEQNCTRICLETATKLDCLGEWGEQK